MFKFWFYVSLQNVRSPDASKLFLSQIYFYVALANIYPFNGRQT